MDINHRTISILTSIKRKAIVKGVAIAMALSFSTLSLAEVSSASHDREVRPLVSPQGELLANVHAVKDIKPFYPRPALKERQQGYVLLSYSVTRDGKVDDVKVVEEYPQKTFTSSARRALKASEFVAYNPKGKKSRVEGLLRRYEFVLAMNENVSLSHPWE